ncbi:phosphotransferase [Stenotrophomonas sp. RG-453]|uniref:phosphotransferase enzyme family protein n=1 Tax=Stenotrophomonas sp. RG-453 TaxID=2957502 RepID=UPI0029CA6E48|nr:phosphotransferase [Stenotrophomonas sp. RG-453]MDX5517545.1 phosphotransferase [Stenotrophomonas sp. RG-453]
MSNSTHRVQGLNNDEVAADWPAITEREVSWLRERFASLAGAGRLQWHSPRPMSAAAIVETDGERVFVKRHHGSVRTAASLAEEHRFIQHLADHGVPVVEVLRDRDGATAVEHEGWTYELHRVGQGQDLYRDAPSWTPLTDTAQAREAGRMLAKLHSASACYHAPQRSTHLLVARDDLIRAADPIAAIQADLPGRPGLAAYLARQDWQGDLRRAVAPWHAGLVARLQAEPRLWAHNDWHVSNLLWRQQGDATVVDTVLDLGLASPTSALFDLATAIERNAIAWLALEGGEAAVRVDIALALLAGYREIVPLSAKRVHLLADLLPIVQLDFALSEVEYFQGVTHSPANADVAYHTFLLGHADWFSSAAGQGLLKALHAAA